MERLFSLGSVAIIGMGKNTGKTSFLNLLLKEAGKRHPEKVMAVTSIGRDGEERDLVTGTEKPRIYVLEGTLVATSEELLSKCDVTKEILEITGIRSSLGRVVIFRALSDGFVEIAGPSRGSDLAHIEKTVKSIEKNCLFIVDGALSRMSFSSKTDGAVLCTGASISHSQQQIYEKTMHALSFLMLRKTDKELPEGLGRAHLKNSEEWTEVKGDIALSIGSEISGQIKESTSAIYIRGAVTDRLIRDFLSSRHFRNLALIAGDGTQYLMSIETLEKLNARGIRLEAENEIQLKMLMVNPFDPNGGETNLRDLMVKLRNELDIPVYSLAELKGEKGNDVF